MNKDTINAIALARDARPVRILFVCLGNICRSPAAEGVMKQIVDEHGMADRFVIDSAGTGRYHIGDLPDKRMRVHALRRGLELTHICRQVRVSDFDVFDLVIGMDDYNIENLRNIARSPGQQAKIIAMGEFITMATADRYIPDPYYEGAEGFEKVLDLLQDACGNLFDQLTRPEQR